MNLGLPNNENPSAIFQNRFSRKILFKNKFNFKRNFDSQKHPFQRKSSLKKQQPSTKATLSNNSLNTVPRPVDDLPNSSHLKNFKPIVRKNFAKRRPSSPLKRTKPFRFLHGLRKNQTVVLDDPPSVEDARQKILHSLYFKNEKYFYSSRISFRTLLQKIYYENYKLRNVKEFIIPCFKRLKDVRGYFDVLFREAKAFNEAVRGRITEKLLKLKNDEDPDERNDTIFKPFPKAVKQYSSLVDLLFDSYRHLETVNYEIEKLTKLYLDNYVKKTDALDFDTQLFHKSMFVNNVYKDGLVQTAIEELYAFFCKSAFYNRNFEGLCEKVAEIYEYLANGLDCEEECIEEDCVEKDCRFDSFFSSSSVEKEVVYQKEESVKKKKKRKKRKKKGKKKEATEQEQKGEIKAVNETVKKEFDQFCERLKDQQGLKVRIELGGDVFKKDFIEFIS